jgi:hypothetical protein
MPERYQLHSTLGGHTLFDSQWGECFKSRHDVDLEVAEVFLGPGLWEGLAKGEGPRKVLELGFGLGTIFRHWQVWAKEQSALQRFETIERDCSGAELFLTHQPDEGVQTLLTKGEWTSGQCQARLWKGTFEEVLPLLVEKEASSFNAIFFDPFSPKSNGDSWSLDIFAHCYSLLRPGGRLVTYSVSKVAKQNAAQAGFNVNKKTLPKNLGKKESLIATKPDPVLSSSTEVFLAHT